MAKATYKIWAFQLLGASKCKDWRKEVASCTVDGQ